MHLTIMPKFGLLAVLQCFLATVMCYTRKHMTLFGQLARSVTVRESGINKEVVKVGNGRPIESGDILAVEYKAFVKGSAKPFAQGKKETCVVKDGTMIKAWDAAVCTMKVNEKARFDCKAELAYGKAGISNVIPPDADIILEVEVLAWLGNQLRPATLFRKDLDTDPLVANTPESILAAFEDKQAKKASMFAGSVFDIYKRRLESTSFGFGGSGFFTSQSGEKAPWYLNPNLTFPAMIAIVTAAFVTVFLNGAVREKGVNLVVKEVTYVTSDNSF